MVMYAYALGYIIPFKTHFLRIPSTGKVCIALFSSKNGFATFHDLHSSCGVSINVRSQCHNVLVWWSQKHRRVCAHAITMWVKTHCFYVGFLRSNFLYASFRKWYILIILTNWYMSNLHTTSVVVGYINHSSSHCLIFTRKVWAILVSKRWLLQFWWLVFWSSELDLKDAWWWQMEDQSVDVFHTMLWQEIRSLTIFFVMIRRLPVCDYGWCLSLSRFHVQQKS
jgi:hypothetical protein